MITIKDPTRLLQLTSVLKVMKITVINEYFDQSILKVDIDPTQVAQLQAIDFIEVEADSTVTTLG